MSPRRQPFVGITSAVIVIAISWAFIAVLDWPFFRDWASYYLMCTIPFAFVVGAFWHGEHPAALTRLRQPWRGVAFLALAVVLGAVVGTVLLFTVGGGVTPPTPNVTQCVIISVPFSFWFTVMLGGWPFTKVRSRLLGGALILISTYVLAALVFRLFSYDFLKGAPVYVAALDPQGPFDAWTALVFIVTAMAGAFVMLHFGLWPLTKRPSLMTQPILGALWTLCALAVSAVACFVGIGLLGMAAPTFLTTVTVPFLFGSIIILITLENSLFTRLAQPVRGLVSTLTAAIVGVLLARLFVAVSGILSGDLPWGPPAFEGEIWLASALLAVTFPFLSYHADFFGTWPLKGRDVREEAADPVPVTPSGMSPGRTRGDDSRA